MTPAVRLLVLAIPAIAVIGSFACGTDPVAVDSCRKIETARCENAPACGLSLDAPVHKGSSPAEAVAACVRYYDTACLHGFSASSDPGGPAVQACVDAINNGGDCNVVKQPELHPSCSFLIPNAPAVDAAAE
jgi:hypothetical protein